MFLVIRFFIDKETQVENHSVQKYDKEILARKRFWNILAADADDEKKAYELVQIVTDAGLCIASQVFDRRTPGVE